MKENAFTCRDEAKCNERKQKCANDSLGLLIFVKSIALTFFEYGEEVLGEENFTSAPFKPFSCKGCSPRGANSAFFFCKNSLQNFDYPSGLHLFYFNS